MTPSPPVFMFCTFVTSNFVNEFGIDVHVFLIICWKVFLLMYLPFSRPIFRFFLIDFHICLLSFFFGERSATRILLGKSYDSRTCTFF